jgi:hypothetical protein
MFDFREWHEEDPHQLFLDDKTGAVVKFVPTGTITTDPRLARSK